MQEQASELQADSQQGDEGRQTIRAEIPISCQLSTEQGADLTINESLSHKEWPLQTASESLFRFYVHLHAVWCLVAATPEEHIYN